MSEVQNESVRGESDRSLADGLCLAGLGKVGGLSLLWKKEALAVLKSKMTARDLINSISGLQGITEDLAKKLADSCRSVAAGEHESCGGKCDFEDTCELAVPPCILAEAGIPLDRPLLAYVEKGSIVIRVEEETFPAEVTGELLRLLVNAEVDAEGLSALLKGERIVYGE